MLEKIEHLMVDHGWIVRQASKINKVKSWDDKSEWSKREFGKCVLRVFQWVCFFRWSHILFIELSSTFFL